MRFERTTLATMGLVVAFCLQTGLVLAQTTPTAGTPTASSAKVPAPTVTGPIAAPGIPGAAEHNYIFFASKQDLAIQGYVEEEFFIQGTANRYNTPTGATASIVDKDHPYKTRIVVRRPADPKRFNGTVLVEWDNVTNNFDAENMWF